MSINEAFFLPLLIALAGFVAIWPLSVLRRDASLVDLAWGPGFLVQLAVAMWVAGATGPHGWLLLAIVGAWSIRLTAVLARRRLREGHEDPRYTIVRDSWGPSFWWKSLFIVFVLQAVLQWLITLGPMAGAFATSMDIGALAWLGAAIALAGLALETAADAQLDRFKQTARSDALLTSGLRAHVRHPNFCGEILFWSGIAVISLDAGTWAGVISPLLITFFLVRVSGAPMLDERLSATRPAYAAYRARVPAFIPALRVGAAREHQ